MVKIQPLSDLHLEHDYNFIIPKTDADVIVLAGDIDQNANWVKWLLNQKIDKPIIYVMGNHCFYRSNVKSIKEKIRKLIDSYKSLIEIHFLDDSYVDIYGVRFLGSTLWTDFSLYGDPIIAGIDAQTYINDYTYIRVTDLYRKITYKDTIDWHKQSVKFLTEELAKDVNIPKVVVTHMLPSIKSVSERFIRDTLSAAYASNLDHLVVQSKLWIHGHTHDTKDYFINDSRVVCNPRGYKSDNQDFNPSLVIEV